MFTTLLPLLVTSCLALTQVDLFDPDNNNNVQDSHFLPRQHKTYVNRTFPGMPGFPSGGDEWRMLANRLSGGQAALISPFVPSYASLALMHNVRVTKEPYIIVMVNTAHDVREAMLFARKYNLMVAVQSSGHSYIGRSTADGALVINLKNMKKKTVNLQSSRNAAGEIALESGNSWIEVYKEVDHIYSKENGTSPRRVIVGGSAHTVAMGGYTQGGGHSPISRTFGLAVDNLLEAEIVTVDGRILTVSDKGYVATELNGSVSTSNDSSLFWAIRGGGGGTWGVITTFTFKLHYAPERFRNVLLAWTLKNGIDDSFGRETMKLVLIELNKLSPSWGGYMLFDSSAIENSEYSGTLTLFMNHYGTDNDRSNNDITTLWNFNKTGNQYTKTSTNYPTFLGYEYNAKDPAYTNTYIVNTFVQPSTISSPTELNGLVDSFMNMVSKHEGGCTGIMIGGAVSAAVSDATPVNPHFRSGLMAMTCGISWDPNHVANSSAQIDTARKIGLDIRKTSGVYFNECDEDLDDWKTQFWGSMDTYCKLKAVKKEVDPDHFLWCHNCVGSDYAQDDCPAAV